MRTHAVIVVVSMLGSQGKGRLYDDKQVPLEAISHIGLADGKSNRLHGWGGGGAGEEERLMDNIQKSGNEITSKIKAVFFYAGASLKPPEFRHSILPSSLTLYDFFFVQLFLLRVNRKMYFYSRLLIIT